MTAHLYIIETNADPWRHEDQDGFVTIGLPNGDRPSYERALFLLEKARARVMKDYGQEENNISG